MTRQTAPIVVAILLLLPALYLGSYLALVRAVKHNDSQYSFYCHPALRPWYSPLYQLDLKLRPEAWWFHEED